MIRAIFPGSFDPPTFGHLNIIERARFLFDEVCVVIAVNADKKYLFSAEERFSVMRELTERWPNVAVKQCNTLIVEFARQNGANVLIRGVRNAADFSFEFDLSFFNKALSPEIETVFLPTDPKYVVLRSSAIKELASYGGDVSKMVPPQVEKMLREKFPQ